MTFVDIHNHTLWGVDDGPGTEREMLRLLDAAYGDGVRAVCLTPHFHPGYFGDNRPQVLQSFQTLTRYAAEKYPDMRLYLGNELRFDSQCLTWLQTGACRTLNETEHVLVDFYEVASERSIVKALEQLMSAGYTPVLAHAERYRKLSAAAVWELARNGVWIQIDVQSLFGGYGPGARRRCRRLLRKNLVDIVATDAHDLQNRTPILSRGYGYIKRKYGNDCAERLFAENPRRLLEGDGSENE